MLKGVSDVWGQQPWLPPLLPDPKRLGSLSEVSKGACIDRQAADQQNLYNIILQDGYHKRDKRLPL
jgi:hypothetical protein